MNVVVLCVCDRSVSDCRMAGKKKAPTRRERLFTTTNSPKRRPLDCTPVNSLAFNGDCAIQMKVLSSSRSHVGFLSHHQQMWWNTCKYQVTQLVIVLLFCVSCLGHEYYYNDESGESTWRRPRITLHKKSPRDGETSYNSTQWTSPFKPTHPANVDADTVDQFIGDVDESYYDESYWNQSTYGGGDGGVVAETEHNMEYEMDSVGGLSAQTDDSRNMCCHIGQDNADVDIYKVCEWVILCIMPLWFNLAQWYLLSVPVS